ncbi:hypothetical protein GCM10009745_53400 [Kribbella yunnanensis]|uniref:RloB domain-containing protein n=1 Tax=Kribbella yunnanensis TaxID=190194 RepID=A0ABN2I7I8_9ACTN
MIFCEGEASEPDYLNALKRLPEVRNNTAISLEIDPTSGVPLTLVQAAVARMRKDVEVDEYWCVFDVEWPQHHPHLDRTLQIAAGNDINVAVSNPCFELWLILHHQDHGAFLDNRAAESLSRRLDGRTGKRIDASMYLPQRAEASKRAADLAGRHDQNGALFPDDNPSSSMYKLLKAIEPHR